MKKLTIITAILLALFACEKDSNEPQQLTPNSPIVKTNILEKFIGRWTSKSFCGSSGYELIITEGFTDSTIVLHGYATAVINGNTFETQPSNNVIHSGELKDSVLTYIQRTGKASCYGEFTKLN